MALVHVDNAEWIHQQWVEMFLMKCACAIQEARKKARRGNNQPATDLGEYAGKNARINLPVLRNAIFTVMIHWVSNGKDMVLALQQLQALYTGVRHWEELVDFIYKNGVPKDPYIFTSMFECTFVTGVYSLSNSTKYPS
jgi:hypothetical protein